MSKEYVINKTRKIWSLLKDNPQMSKREAYEKLEMKEDERYCPLCEHASLNCLFCLFRKLWAETTNNASKFPHCRNAGSPYRDWCDAESNADKSKCAGQMVDLCDKALGRLLL